MDTLDSEMIVNDEENGFEFKDSWSLWSESCMILVTFLMLLIYCIGNLTVFFRRFFSAILYSRRQTAGTQSLV